MTEETTSNAHKMMPAAEEVGDGSRVMHKERGRGLRVLVVDDEAFVVEVTQNLLSRLGCWSDGVESGIQAIEWLEKDPTISLVILDLTMPNMSGTQTLEEIRRLRHDLPVLISSGHPEAEVEHLTDEAIAFLHKPYTADEFTQAIAQLLCVNLSLQG